MTDQDWPQVGSGVREEEPGPAGSGSSRSQDRDRRLYRIWLRTTYPVTHGEPVNTKVKTLVFAKHIKAMEEEDVPEGYDLEEVLPRAWKIFVADMDAGSVPVRGKNAWFVFYGRRAKYIEMALGRAEKAVADDEEWL